MQRRDFLKLSALGSLGLGLEPFHLNATAQAATRKILIAGGGYGTAFIRYMATLTGQKRPTLLSSYRSCAPIDVYPLVQESFIASSRQTHSWEEALLSVDGIVASGGNTLNQQAIWKAQGIDVALRKCWDNGVVLGGASAGSLCWFEEGTTDSRRPSLVTSASSWSPLPRRLRNRRRPDHGVHGLE